MTAEYSSTASVSPATVQCTNQLTWCTPGPPGSPLYVVYSPRDTLQFSELPHRTLGRRVSEGSRRGVWRSLYRLPTAQVGTDSQRRVAAALRAHSEGIGGSGCGTELGVWLLAHPLS